MIRIILADPNGVELTSLFEEVHRRVPRANKFDIGPALSGLMSTGRYSYVTLTDKDGSKLAVRYNKFNKVSLSRKQQCLKLGHDVPDDVAYQAGGAIMRGGYCRRCHELVDLGCLGNVWTKETVQTNGVVSLEGFDVSVATNQGLKVFNLS